MKVTLMSHTPDAVNLLLRTKNTRLKFDSDPAKWSDSERAAHLMYMRDTIQSSWEFIDYVFQIEDVSRAFTHQFIRTRAGNYAQESQRTIDARDNGWLPLVDERGGGTEWSAYDMACRNAVRTYSSLLDAGVPAQDARGVLPTAMLTSIIAKFNLRTLSDMAKARLCVRTQGEYQDVFRAMRAAVIEVHPWADEFIQVQCVASGTCAFPRYGKKQCPIYDPRMDLDALKAETKKKFWEVRHVAVPIATGGKTM